MYMNVITCTSTFALNFDTCSWSGCGDGGGRQVGDVPPQIINAQTATALDMPLIRRAYQWGRSICHVDVICTVRDNVAQWIVNVHKGLRTFSNDINETFRAGRHSRRERTIRFADLFGIEEPRLKCILCI